MSDVKTENLWLMKGDCLERMKEIPDWRVVCQHLIVSCLRPKICWRSLCSLFVWPSFTGCCWRS